MKLLISLIFSIGLFAQTGIPYYKNGVVTYVNPIGGVVVDVARKQIRTAINGGLRGTPGQLWSVNSNGDGEAINVDWNVFSLLPPGTNGRRTLTLVKQPESMYFNDGTFIVDAIERERVMKVFYNSPGIINFIQINESHLSTKEVRIERVAMLKNVLWVWQNGYFRVKNRDYTLTYESEYVILKFSDLININIGDGLTVVSIN